MHVYPNYYKKNIFFSLSIRMSGNSINFKDKKIKKRLLQKQENI